MNATRNCCASDCATKRENSNAAKKQVVFQGLPYLNTPICLPLEKDAGSAKLVGGAAFSLY
jgi:hypothetical protein